MERDQTILRIQRLQKDDMVKKYQRMIQAIKKIRSSVLKTRGNSPRYVHYVGFVFQYIVHNMESSLTLNLLETQSMCKREKMWSKTCTCKFHMVEHQKERPTKDINLKRPLEIKGPTKWCECVTWQSVFIRLVLGWVLSILIVSKEC